MVGFTVTILTALIGTGLGLLAGFYSGQPLLVAVGILSPQWAAVIAFVLRVTRQFAAVSDGVFVTVTLGWASSWPP